MSPSTWPLNLSDPEWLVGFVALPLLVWYYHRSLVDFPRWQRLLSLACRSLFVVLLVLALTGLTWLIPTDDRFVVFLIVRSQSVGEEARHRNTLGDRTATQLLAELARVRPEGETALYLQLRALLWLQPGQAKQVGAALKAARPDSAALRILPQAMALCGRPQAQAALVEVARARKDDWPVMAEVLPALGQARDPIAPFTVSQKSSPPAESLRTRSARACASRDRVGDPNAGLSSAARTRARRPSSVSRTSSHTG